MNKDRRKFLAQIATIAGLSAIDGFGILKHASAFQSENKAELSKDIRDYPYITDVLRSKNIELHFPLLVSSCADPKMNYLNDIPFLIELEVCKIWKESLFEWDAISNVGAGGLQQLMDFTARGDLGMTIANSPEIVELNTASAENNRLAKEISSKRESLNTLVSAGSGDLTQATIGKINALRSEIANLTERKEKAYNRLKEAKTSYARKIRSLSKDELIKFDSRFVPEICIPAGIKYIVDITLDCQNYFGGPIEMNVWRGLAAYNSGPQKTKDWYGMPFIRETVLYTRDIIFNLSKMMELKKAYSTGDSALIAKTKSRLKL
jgi:membrane-bound lytic murein transglycosylase MltF